MAKKKPAEERQPDLNASDDQAEIEARVKEMMELEEPKPAPKPISVTMHEDESPASAPVLPDTEKKPVAIKIVDHNEEPDATPVEEPVEDADVLEAIAAANAQLKENTENAAKLDGDDEQTGSTDEADTSATVEPAELEPETTDDVEETEAAIAADIAVTQDDEPQTAPIITEEQVDETSTEEVVLPEVADQPVESAKEKPLKHLDSIIPKTKTFEMIENDQTDKAVDEIIAKESDDLLKAEDEKIAATHAPEPKVGFGKKILSAFKSKIFRTLLFLLVIGAAAAGAAFPETRYFALNSAGVRSSASLTVFDESTRQPLKGVTVRLGAQSVQSDQEGKVRFTDLKLGRTNLIVEKRAFAPISKSLVLGWGSNPLDDVNLSPTGAQYRFKVTDFLSGKPVAKVEAVSEDATALSNEKGEIRLTIDQQDDHQREVVITGEGYREERFVLDLNQKDELAIGLVPVRKHAFISKRSGRYDVYKVDADGKNEKLVLPGTGSEREDMVLVHHPTEDVVALISTKDNKRNDDGFLLSTLTVMNLSQETSRSVVTSERIQVIDWIGSRIVYVIVKEGASGDSPDRHKLGSYDYKTQEFTEIASSNYFNDVLIADKRIYYAPSSTYSAGTKAEFYSVRADGTERQTLLNREVWNIFRSDYDKLTMAVEQEWYELRIGENRVAKISGEPPSQTSKIFIASPDGKRSLWVDNRDGKGVLLAYDVEAKKDDTIRIQGGLKQPVRWLDDHTVVYRIHTESESADYVLNLEGGEPKKIKDVTNTSGINTWYYY